MTSLPILHLTLTCFVLTASIPTTPQTHLGREVGKYVGYQGDIICIVIEAAIALLIPYPLRNGSVSTSVMEVPVQAETRGVCLHGEGFQRIDIYFEGLVDLVSFEFKTGDVSDVETNDSHPGYRLETVSLEFKAEERLFPDMAWDEGQFFTDHSQSSNYPHVNADHGYYFCNRTVSFKIGHTAFVELTSLRMKGFVQDNDVEFDGEAAVCSDGTSESHLAVVLVCVTIVIVVICSISMVVACCIVSPGDREGYKPIN